MNGDWKTPANHWGGFPSKGRYKGKILIFQSGDATQERGDIWKREVVERWWFWLWELVVRAKQIRWLWVRTEEAAIDPLGFGQAGHENTWCLWRGYLSPKTSMAASATGLVMAMETVDLSLPCSGSKFKDGDWWHVQHFPFLKPMSPLREIPSTQQSCGIQWLVISKAAPSRASTILP